MVDFQVSLSTNAANRVQFLQQKRGNMALKLRVVVDGGGCSGFQYKIDFTEEADPATDKIFTSHGVSVVVDSVSLEYLDGAEIDYVESLIGASFQIRNPNAASSCGCGASFSV
jgi:iron-sulfur cluster insertion protein